MLRRRRRRGQGQDGHRGARLPELSAQLADRHDDRRGGRGHGAHLRAGPHLPRRPLSRRPALGDRDHPGGRRSLRRRRRRRPGGADPQPGDRRSRSRRLGIGPDPPHPQRDPAEAARTARRSRPARLHAQPDQLRALLGQSDPLGQLPRRSEPGGRQARRSLRPLPGGRLPGARLQPPPRPAPQGRHEARLLPGPQGRLQPEVRRRQRQRLGGPPAEERLPRTGPHPHDLHPGAVRGRKLPQGGPATATSRPGRRCSKNPSRARSGCDRRATSCPTWSSTCGGSSTSKSRPGSTPSTAGSGPASRTPPTRRSPVSCCTCRAARRD